LVVVSEICVHLRHPRFLIRGAGPSRYNSLMPHRSGRIPEDLSPNPLARARQALGRIPFDLTNSNPTDCGIPYPDDLVAALADPRGLEYQPDPRGPEKARLEVAAEIRRWSQAADPDRLILTASTSEAYSLLFRLLADPGDAVLVPEPSYPLFDHLARLDGVSTTAYPLDADTGWRPCLSTIREAPDGVRALIVVHPNNPTGSYIETDDAHELAEICRQRGWALIADEVFFPYPLDGGNGRDFSFSVIDRCLTFTLGGLSKSVGLPQLKLAWMTANGPESEVTRALEGLDFAADAYLSVSTPIALAASEVVRTGTVVREAIRERCRNNLATMRRLVDPVPAVTIGPVGGGWSAVLRAPALCSDEELCLRLLEREGVALHPGESFGFPTGGYLVTSLLPRIEIVVEGISRTLSLIADLAEDRR
jgi:aspartate/methionine/tyrosine aminotransferase